MNETNKKLVNRDVRNTEDGDYGCENDGVGSGAQKHEQSAGLIISIHRVGN